MSKAAKKLIISLLLVLLLCCGGIWYYRLPFHKQIGSGFVTVYHTKHRSDFNAEFVIITKIRGHYIVELIQGEGPENVTRLDGKEAMRFIIDHGFVGE